jgi:hypothetical protein
VFDRVRFVPAPGFEKDMVGGKFSGSNVSYSEGYETLAEITAAPKAKQWNELEFDGRKPHRWIRYEGPPGSHGRVAEIEFYSGKRRLNGPRFGSIGHDKNGADWPRAFDEKLNTFFSGEAADGQFVGLDTQDAATAARPIFDPEPSESLGPFYLAMRTPTPGAEIRYTLDGAIPDEQHGLVYKDRIPVERTTTVVAASFKAGFAPSSPSSGTWLVGPELAPTLSTLHIGNSLTQTAGKAAEYDRTAGYRHTAAYYTLPGAPTPKLWDRHTTDEEDAKNKWEKAWSSLQTVDHLTVQPRDMDLDKEAIAQKNFFDLVRTKSPQVQPWLYAEWTFIYRNRPPDEGVAPNPVTEMTKLEPALTWEESAGAWLLYVEELHRKTLAIDTQGRRSRILPKNLVDHRRIPGLGPESFRPLMFFDSVHPGPEGAYLVDMTWSAAFYGRSPEGRYRPVNTRLTAEQARAFERLAWDVVLNYPDCGFYQEGTSPVGEPQFNPAPFKLSENQEVTLSSSTPGAWFRYTLDGVAPTRTRGYVYCGVITVRPGMKVKAIAYKSGMADSVVKEADYAKSAAEKPAP